MPKKKKVEKKGKKKKEIKKPKSQLGFVAKSLDFFQKSRIAVFNRIWALNEHKLPKDPVAEELLPKVKEIEKFLDKKLRDKMETHPAWKWANQVKGLGKTNIGKVIGEINIEIVTTVSRVWAWAGYDPNRDKLIKGQEAPFNTYLRSMCWRVGQGLKKASKGQFYRFYKEEKKRITDKHLANGFKIIPTARLPKRKSGSNLLVYEILNDNDLRKAREEYKYKGKETRIISLGHIDNWAVRIMIKMFLAMLVTAWRNELGLPMRIPYSNEKQGHTKIYKPEDFIGLATDLNKNRSNKRAILQDKNTVKERATFRN